MKEQSSIEKLLSQYGTPVEGVLDTPEKIQEYRKRMKEATEEEMKANRVRRAKSALAAKTRIIS